MEKKGKKLPLIIIAAVLLVIVAVIVILKVFLNKNEAYRIIKVYEVNGEAIVTRDGIGELSVYQDMLLESGDKVCLTTGEMTLRLDEDKYVYVEPDTEFSLVATGNSSNSKTSIELVRGAITNDIQNPLSEESSYEVNTPNSNMSVRGTVFRVCTYYEGDVRYTKVSVFDGKVESELKYADGSVSENAVMIQDGNEVYIYDDQTTTDYVGEQSPINYEELPQEVLVVLKKIIEAGTDIGITYDEINSYLNSKAEPAGPFTVTFMYNGNVFGTQIIEKGKLAAIPSLKPAQSGNWDFDFSTEIYSDTTIEWR